MDEGEIRKNIGRFEKLFPKNRLIGHLSNCATVNACANAKNFFLERFEAPIPTSPVCNAQCQGCISFQPKDRLPSTQPRIQFTPTPEEIAQLAVFHIEHVANPIVSFGQGCEGEPSLAVDTIEKAIRLIRGQTSKGSLNMNSNASRPGAIMRLFDAGLDTLRVSTNTVREPYYSRYYQPRGYSLNEFFESIEIAKKVGGFVSVNYLSMPGFTDSEAEAEAFVRFIEKYRIDMVQWRNLNYDPLHYFRDLQIEPRSLQMLGMKELIESIRKNFPQLVTGYFNLRPKKLKSLHPIR
jgi:pyruvate-formate lyase-activating enzyme